MEITMKEKNAISERLRAYVAKYPSQTKAAGSLKGVSVGTVSNILNGRFENISDEMFRNVAPRSEVWAHPAGRSLRRAHTRRLPRCFPTRSAGATSAG